MLILTRKINEDVIIGGNITVKIVGVRGNQVRLGFEAPDDVPIYREEVYRKIQLEGRKKAGG